MRATFVRFAQLVFFAFLYLATAGQDQPACGDPCSNVDCKHGTCFSEGDTASCDCNDGYKNDGPRKCVKKDKPEPCDPNPCTTGDHSRCEEDGDSYECLCPLGFVEDNNGDCVTEDPCDPNPCTEGDHTECVDLGDGDHLCDCPSGQIEDDNGICVDEILDPCDPNPCDDDDHTRCVATDETEYTCECPENLVEDQNGDCVEPNACIPNPCTNGDHIRCRVDAAGFVCECPEGMTENAALQCVDATPCEPNPCAWRTDDGHTVCITEGLDYDCQCPGTQIENSSGICVDPGGCATDPCTVGDHTRCVPDGPVNYTCECPFGKAEDTNGDCVDVSPCDPNPCIEGDHIRCEEVSSTEHYCYCPEGMHEDANSGDCVLTDPCEGWTCGDHGHCQVVEFRAVCICDTDYIADFSYCRHKDEFCTVEAQNNGGDIEAVVGTPFEIKVLSIGLAEVVDSIDVTVDPSALLTEDGVRIGPAGSYTEHVYSFTCTGNGTTGQVDFVVNWAAAHSARGTCDRDGFSVNCHAQGSEFAQRSMMFPDGYYGRSLAGTYGYRRISGYAPPRMMLEVDQDMVYKAIIMDLQNSTIDVLGQNLTYIENAKMSYNGVVTAHDGGSCYVNGEIEGGDIHTAYIEECDWPELSGDGLRLTFQKRVGDYDWQVLMLDVGPGANGTLELSNERLISPAEGYGWANVEAMNHDGSCVVFDGEGTTYLYREGESLLALSQPEESVRVEAASLSDDCSVIAWGADIAKINLSTGELMPLYSLASTPLGTAYELESGSADRQLRYVTWCGSIDPNIFDATIDAANEQCGLTRVRDGKSVLLSVTADGLTGADGDCKDARIDATGASLVFACEGVSNLVDATGGVDFFWMPNPLFEEGELPTDCHPVERQCVDGDLVSCPNGASQTVHCLTTCVDAPQLPRCQPAWDVVRSTGTVASNATEKYAIASIGEGSFNIEVVPDEGADVRVYICAVDATDCTFDGNNLASADAGTAGATETLVFDPSAEGDYVIVVESADGSGGDFDVTVLPPVVCTPDATVCVGENVGVCNAAGNGATAADPIVCVEPCESSYVYARSGCGTQFEADEDEPEIVKDLGAMGLGRLVAEGHVDYLDVDVFSFTLTVDALVNMSTVVPQYGDVDSNLYGFIALYNAPELVGDNYITSSTRPTPPYAELGPVLLTAGTYYIRMGATTSGSSSRRRGDYRLLIDTSAPICLPNEANCAGADIELCNPDATDFDTRSCAVSCVDVAHGSTCGYAVEVEPNGEFASATPVHVPVETALTKDVWYVVEGELDDQGVRDEDWFEFAVSGETNVVIEARTSKLSQGSVDLDIDVFMDEFGSLMEMGTTCENLAGDILSCEVGVFPMMSSQVFIQVQHVVPASVDGGPYSLWIHTTMYQ